jgi:hypothetical protein
LAVRIAPSGLKTWDLAYRIKGSGKMRRPSLGRVDDLPLERARERLIERKKAALISWDARLRAIIAGEPVASNIVDLRKAG